MTRLRTEDITDISAQLQQYDRELVRKTRRTLRGIACHALDINEEELFPCSPEPTAPNQPHQKILKTGPVFAVVPINSGQGVISRFSSTVRDIVAHIGFEAFVTEAADVAGIAEAVEKGADVIMMADDFRFIALCVKSRHIVDNTDATTKGFVAGLDLMAGGIAQQNVLVIGCGPVGRSSVLAAIHRGANVSVYDIDSQRSRELAEEIKKMTRQAVTVKESIDQRDISSGDCNLIVEATNSAGVIDEADISTETYIAAPGMPLGLTPAAVRKVSDRLLHDPLQLGVAVMAVEAAKRVSP